MRGLSARPKDIIQCLSIYRGVDTRPVNRIEGKSPAIFRSPKPGFEKEYKPCIIVFNGDSQKTYQIFDNCNHEATQCIMGLIRERFVIPKGEEALFYIIFVLLHEVGHWHDYHERRKWYDQNFTDDTRETEEEYRQRPCEKSADGYALDHFEDAWNELNNSLFRGLMEPLKRVEH